MRSAPLLQFPISVLFSEPKIPQIAGAASLGAALIDISVLFSEPKIPQTPKALDKKELVCYFSALQRAENSSNEMGQAMKDAGGDFSALQRAENSSNWEPSVRGEVEPGFQCSSASRKFLKSTSTVLAFAADARISVLFSEPKIPQTKWTSLRYSNCWISVLFSEPKIPQNQSRRTVG